MSTATIDYPASSAFTGTTSPQRTYITGRTWPVRHQLKELGCKWDVSRKEWYALDEETARQAQALVPGETPNRHKRQLGLIDQFCDPSKPNEDTRERTRPSLPPIVPAVATMPARRLHYLFPLVKALCAARIPVYLVGPAGSFKTSTAHAAAEELGLTFYSTSVCAQTTKADLLGFIDAGGTYRGTAFRKAFEHGGVFLMDEIDAGNANTIAVLNAALANGEMTFPDGQVKRHADFCCIAAANTFGGATVEYVGRNQLDAATLDRFAVLPFPYDEAMELSLIGCPVASEQIELWSGGVIDPIDWAQWVLTVRKAVAELKLRVVVTPRASLHGATLAKAGIGRYWLERLFIFKTLDDSTRAKILAAAPR